MPVRLPSSCLTMAPRLEKLEEANSARPPFLELQPGDVCRGSTGSPAKEPSAQRRDGKVQRAGCNVAKDCDNFDFECF